MSSPRFAVIGAGLELAGDIVGLLLDRGVAADHIRVLDGEETAGETLEVRDLRRRIEWATPDAAGGADIALLCGRERLASELVPELRSRGVVVVDSTPYSRGDDAVPLVVPEVNPERLTSVEPGTAIASPSPAVIGLALALAPLHRVAGLKRVVATVMESASQRGASAIEELSHQAVQLMRGEGLERSDRREQIAFNLRVQAPESEGGWSSGELAIGRELPLVLGIPALAVTATVVRAPVFFGSAQAVHVDLERDMALAEAEAAIRGGPGLLLAGSIEDRLATAVEAARRREEHAASVNEGEDERNDAEELAEDGLEEVDEDTEEDGEVRAREYGDDYGDTYGETGARRADESRGRGRREPGVGERAADLLPGPVDVSGSEFVHVARLRLDPLAPGGLALWIAFDELRRGIAVNLVAIAQLVWNRRA
jgi:aspartate-semialdehyde dehydrogenase